MKKFISLFVIAAVLAFAGTAFATDGDVSAIAAYDGFTTNAVNNEVGSSGSDWTVQAFYYGTVQNLMIGTKLTVDGASAANATRYGAKVGTAAVVFNDAAPAVNLTSAENVRFNMPFSASGIDMVIGAYTASGTDAIAATKTLHVLTTKLNVTAKDGTDDVNNKTINVKTTRDPFDIIVAGTAGPDGLDTTNLVVKSGDTPVPTSTSGFTQWSSSNGKIAIDPKQAKAGDTLVITVKAPETNSAKVLKNATNTEVAGVTEDTVFATITINFVDYIVTPASATWDASTASGGVAFTIKDLTAEKISKIEINGHGVGPDVLDPANYTATTNGADVEIELKLEYLEGLSKNDYTFTITDESSKTASFALSVTPKGSSKDDKGGEENAASSEEVAKAQTELDKIVPGITVRPSVSTDTVDMDTLPSVASTGEFYRVAVESATLAKQGDAIAIGAKKIGARLPAESTANGISFVKVFDEVNGLGIVPLDEVCGYNASTGLYELDATVVIIDGEAPATKPARFVRGARDGEGVAIVKTDEGNFVYIWDGKKDGTARDPIFARETSSHSSSGACDMGFGLVAVAGLAALALRKRSK